MITTLIQVPVTINTNIVKHTLFCDQAPSLPLATQHILAKITPETPPPNSMKSIENRVSTIKDLTERLTAAIQHETRNKILGVLAGIGLVALLAGAIGLAATASIPLVIAGCALSVAYILLGECAWHGSGFGDAKDPNAGDLLGSILTGPFLAATFGFTHIERLQSQLTTQQSYLREQLMESFQYHHQNFDLFKQKIGEELAKLPEDSSLQEVHQLRIDLAKALEDLETYDQAIKAKM